ncbi:5,10-methenyltetrahydrofolate synthetase [Nitrosopumilus sp. b1]|uniref:5,10-methenyltetrahydrofolate synthetase n=1 Tax=Nitrosopumilus sp. b1 TaxID=2109907 RepID=UPI0015F4FED9|nr:5,10-methenyltetrahydrofolate synthetase [Nitrosopumilus sp. b1]KAF6243695.1 5,10-methenyltetrahydrofolate synthetase [Nitrosopumilus sp. b1]
MPIRFEINPPKVIQDSILSHKELEESVSKLKQRIVDISQNCDGIHLTDSVLGVPRISPITVGALIRKKDQHLKITASLRTRDRNLTSLTQSLCDALLLGLNGMLILKGDAPPAGPKDSGLIPSQAVKHFKEIGFREKIDLFLSLPNYPDFEKIQKKIDAEPTGFVTQVIHTEDEVARIVDKLKPQGFKVIPVVLLPSEKNKKSAEFLRLDWSNYQNRVTDFIEKVANISESVILTSPNDFTLAKSTLEQIKESR